jgi:saccharopine dehydrogenase (NAD+, L-lysine-forming)
VRVAVLGAAGTIAPAIVRDLAESEEVSGLVLIDLNEPGAGAVAEAHGLGKAVVRGEWHLEDCDVLVNSASYRMNIGAMSAALDAGCHYLDLGGLYWMTGRQLELHREFEQAGLLAVLGIGSSPGKTNVMAVRAARELGGRVDALHVAAAGRDLDPPDGPSAPYALQTLVDEVTLAPVVLRDGEPAEIEPLHEGGRVSFPDPIGETDTIHTLHSELRTFGDSFGCREASFRLSLSPALLERLHELQGASPEDVTTAAARTLPPSSRTVSAHLVDAEGPAGKVRVSCVTQPMEEWGLGGGIVSTGAPAAATVRLLARGALTARGAMPPEGCLDPDDLFPELERRSAKFHVEANDTQEAVRR